MMASLVRGLGTLAAALLAVLSAPAAAQVSTTANGPYYATPSWDQKLTTNRFVILLNWNSEAVLDRETGQVWERSPDTVPRDWLTAQYNCTARAIGNRKGWRLPGVHELFSLVDPAVSPGPTLPVGHPFLNVQSSVIYWSANALATDATSALGVLFNVGGLFGVELRSSTKAYWCVRGGQGANSLW